MHKKKSPSYMCTYTALNYKAKICRISFLCKKSEQEETLNPKKANTAMHAQLLTKHLCTINMKV